jgi:hypothetical protein
MWSGIQLIVTRDITRKECRWLSKDIPAGTVVYDYGGHTYQCISKTGRAVTEVDDTPPFFELPRDALKRVERE